MFLSCQIKGAENVMTAHLSKLIAMRRIRFSATITVILVGVGTVLEMFLKIGLDGFFSAWFVAPVFFVFYFLGLTLSKYVNYK